MKKYDHIIIGFGKGGKTLAGAMAAQGQKVLLIEKSDKMFGGTCINVACIPTKILEHRARMAKNLGGDYAARAARYKKAVEEKRETVETLRKKNYNKAIASRVTVQVGEASFVDEHVIQVQGENGDVEQIWGEQIYINTGARPFIPDIPGLKESRFAYTSETLMEEDVLPKRLVIIGGGYIGLEFSSYYTNFGSQVTIIQDGDVFLPREDEEIARVVLESLQKRGVQVRRKTQTMSVKDGEQYAIVSIKDERGVHEIKAEAILVATGRRPNIASLHLERAGVELTERGAVRTDEALHTSKPHIWAMGDVTGGLQFTYISLDDSRIVKSQLLGDGSRTTKNRGEVPYSVFIDPPFSRVGLTEAQAMEKGYQIKVARMPAAAIPKAQVVTQPDGILKVIIDVGTNHILGAHLFCAESHEIINLVKLAMDADLPYMALRDAIYTHPTMSEALNDLLSTI